MMPTSTENQAPSPPPRSRLARLRRFRYLVIGIFVLSFLGWLWAGVWRPYQKTQAAVAVLNREEVAFTLEPCGPEWFELLNFGGLFDRIVEVQHTGSLEILRQPEVASGLMPLERIFVFDETVNRQDIAALAEFPNLQVLSITNGQIHRDALELVGNLDQLEGLYLHHCGIQDADIPVVSQLKGLESLSVTHAAITDEGLKHLRNLKRLRTLNLAHTQVTSAGVETLKKSLPECTVFYQ